MRLAARIRALGRPKLTALAGIAVVSAGAVAGLAPMLGTSAAAATPRAAAPMIKSINVSKYPGVLGNSKSHSLYLLSDEKGGKLHCVGGCLQIWVPLYVSKGSHPAVGAGVHGKVGTVARKLSKTNTKYQLTYNSYPVYVYSGDSGPKQANGQGIQFSSGVWWYLVKASATTPAKTPDTKASSGGGGTGW